MAIFDVSTLSDSGAGSLRQAIADANAAAGADTITFQSAVTGTITLTSGEIDITDSLTIDGPGAAMLSVSGNDSSRIFYIYNPAVAPVDVTISGLTLTDGRSFVSGNTVASRGGAINAVGENLTIEDSVVKDSQAAGDGGGIASAGAALNIRNTTIRMNDAQILTSTVPIAGQGGDGGGVFANDSTGVALDTVTLERNDAGFDGGGIQISSPQSGASITILDSTLHSNSAGPLLHWAGPFPDHTGGGFSLESVPDFAIRRSTMSGNVVSYAGGAGGRIIDSQGLIENSTFSGGYAAGSGPGGGLGVSDSTVTVSHTTIVDNFALGRSDGSSHWQGNGLHAAAASTVNVSNSIFESGADDLFTEGGSSIALRYSYVRYHGAATIQDNGGNIIDPGSSVPWVTGALQNNGGPTMTRLPQGVVVNAGDPAFSSPPATDQRGLSRIDDGRIDMGAVELHAGTIQFATNASSIGENGASVAVTLTRTGGTDGSVTATLSVAGGGTATQGSDFSIPAPPSVSWPANDSTPKSKTIVINDDATYEGDETFILQIAGAGAAEIGTIRYRPISASQRRSPTRRLTPPARRSRSTSW